MPYVMPEVQRAYRRNWLAERRQRFFEGKVCVQCGSADRLQLDHIDPAEKVSHKVWSWAKERRDAELAKCQVLCGACHIEKHGRLRMPGHGTDSRYRHGTMPCKCDACRAAHAAARQRLRIRARRVPERGFEPPLNGV